jgi:hypothetical protein
MYIIDSTCIKLEDDETCALLKSDTNQYAPINIIITEILNLFNQFPEVKKRVIAKLAITEGLTINT